MKAAQIIENRKPLLVGEVPDPTPGPNDIIVKVEASGICRSDWHAWMGDWEWIGLSPELPIIPGHEFGGSVAAVGSNVTKFKEGDRVTTPFHRGCAVCENCRKGQSNRCDDLQIFGLNFDGAYAEYMLVPNGDFNLVHLPDSVDTLSAAAIGCRYMTGYHGVTRGGVLPGEWVVVHGVGGVGLSTVQVAVANGGLVIAVDVDDKKLEMAKNEGAVATINARNENVPEAVQEITKGGAHVSLEALGIKETIQNSVLSLRKGGRHVQMGLTTTEEGGYVDLPSDMISAMELTFIGSLGNPLTDYDRLLQLVGSGKLNPKRLITREVALDDATDVLHEMTEFKTFGFNVITTF